MAKGFKPGIPDNFSFDVEPVSDLGDYLDETPIRKPIVARETPKSIVVPTDPVVAAPPVVGKLEIVEEIPVANADVQVPTVEVKKPIVQLEQETDEGRKVFEPTPAPKAISVRPKAPRREISMTPETLDMSDELLELVRSGSGQRDTKANEMFHALVLLVHEVKEKLDVYFLPKRGRWGTPTAKAYPHELKNAFLKALLEKHAKQ